MRFRQLSVLAAACAVAALGLTACTSKVGAAAIVNGSRISDNTVNSYLKPGATAFSITDSSGSPETIVPRSYVLQYLVETRLFEQALAQTGGPATPAELDAAQTTALSGSTVAQFQAAYAKYNFQTSFSNYVLRFGELVAILEKRVGDDGTGTKTTTALGKVPFTVQVNPRYGTWDSKQFTIDTTSSDGLPSFVKFVPAPSAPSAAAAGSTG